MKDKSEKPDLKLNVQKNKKQTNKKMKIMASSPIISWQTEGGKVETVTDFISLDSKITADCDCSHEIKRPGIKPGSPALQADPLPSEPQNTYINIISIDVV